MYKAKAGGRARYEIFNAAMHEQANYRLRLETELRTALERKEFEVYYQPIVEMKHSQIIGFEALIRWIHPKRGIISPADFIPLAEETGLIVPIGEWVLNESCRQLSAWRDGNSLYDELGISVNLSLKQFDKSDLVERVSAILKSNNLPPHLLRLEITESHVMENAGKTAEVMNKLRELGVKISIDDFGTGYSSLSYLHQLPVNYLKIDRSFVSRMQNNREKNEIVRTVLLLAENLGFQVIAEGVETEQQADQLEMLNCDFAQGFLYSKPVTADEALNLLNKNSFAGDLPENTPLKTEGLVG
jgi:EAL domain-containing protein (putative c-di-GMP-specific phosphodiesterase class I)